MGALYGSRYLWVILRVSGNHGAVLLLVNRYVPLAVAVLAPVIVNILAFHALMAQTGLPPVLLGCGTVGADLRRCATGLCLDVPVAAAGTGLSGAS